MDIRYTNVISFYFFNIFVYIAKQPFQIAAIFTPIILQIGINDFSIFLLDFILPPLFILASFITLYNHIFQLFTNRHPPHPISHTNSSAYLPKLFFKSLGLHSFSIPASTLYLSNILITIFIESGFPIFDKNILS